MFGRVGTFFAGLKKRFSLVEFIIGGYNFGTGTTCMGGSFNNYLAYEFSLRLLGNCIILGVVGSALAIIEVFPNPDLIDRHAHFLNTYHGRGVLYMAIALMSADSRGVADQHKWYVYLTWLNAATIFCTSIFYICLGLVDMYWKQLPVSKSMTTSARAGTKILTSDASDPVSTHKEAGWTVTDGNNDHADEIKSIHEPRTPYFMPSHEPRTPYGDPFDQNSVDQSGWKRHPSSTTGLPAPLVMESKAAAAAAVPEAGSTYSIDMSHPSYAYQPPSATTDSYVQWTKSPEIRNEYYRSMKGDSFPMSVGQKSPTPFHRIKYTREASSNHDNLLPTLAYRPKHDSRGNSQIMFAQDHQSPRGPSGWTREDNSKPPSKKPMSSPRVRRSTSKSKHKRVFVPGVGPFDLSSGDETEKETEEADIISEYASQHDSDNDSVYSLDSDIDIARPGPATAAGTAKLGRKLTRKETRTYKAKLNRGMQRAMSQRKPSSTGEKSPGWV